MYWCCASARTPIDYASVSDKIWPHFASRGIQRVPLQVLLNRGLITHVCIDADIELFCVFATHLMVAVVVYSSIVLYFFHLYFYLVV